MSSIGCRLLSALVYSGEAKEFIKLGLFPDLFRDGSEIALFDFVNNHVQSFGVIPSAEIIVEKVGDVLAKTTEPIPYYMRELENRYLQAEMKKIQIEVAERLKAQQPEEAFQTMMDMALPLNLFRNKKNLFDLAEAGDLIAEENKKIKLAKQGVGGVFSGYPTLDDMNGGFRPGDFIAVVGRPGSGKTWKLLNIANNIWMKGGSPLVLSMEMAGIDILQRATSLHTKVPYGTMIKGEISNLGMTHLKSKLVSGADKEKKYWVMDGNLAATVSELKMLAMQLKPTIILVDGAYLMRHPNPRLGRFERVTENAEAMKRTIAAELEVPVVGSYQLGREATKKTKKKKGVKEDVGIEDIYGTDALGQISSIVLALLQDEIIETQVKRYVSILKGRKGEIGRYPILWDFVKMDFGEPTGDGKGQMQYMG